MQNQRFNVPLAFGSSINAFPFNFAVPNLSAAGSSDATGYTQAGYGTYSHNGGPYTKRNWHLNFSTQQDAPANIVDDQSRSGAWVMADPSTLSPAGLLQQNVELQGRLANSVNRYMQTQPTMDLVRHAWAGQAYVDSLIQQYAETMVFSKQLGWGNTGTMSTDGNNIIRYHTTGKREVITTNMFLEIEDVSAWKNCYRDPLGHRLDGPEDSAFTGKHIVYTLSLEYGQPEVVHCHSSSGNAIKNLKPADVGHKVVFCAPTEEKYIRRHVPEGMVVIPTEGRWYMAYTIGDIVKTSKIDYHNRFRVLPDRATKTGFERIRSFKTAVNQSYQKKLDAYHMAAPQYSKGGMTGQWP